MTHNRRIRVRIEIGPVEEAEGVDSLDGVEEEAVDVIADGTAASIDEMEERLLENGYAVMRRALASHFAAVSKRGLSTGRRQAG